MPVDIFDYIASSRTNDAVAVIQQYGYQLQDVQTTDDLSTALTKLVQAEGEPAMKSILAIHPDKEAILEEFAAKTPSPANTAGCPGCNGQRAINQYLADAGAAPAAQQQNNSVGNFLQSQGNLFLIAGFLLVTVALLKSDK